MKLTQQQLNFIVIMVVAIIGIGIPIYVCCFALMRTYLCAATSSDQETRRNKSLPDAENQIKVTKLMFR